MNPPSSGEAIVLFFCLLFRRRKQREQRKKENASVNNTAIGARVLNNTDRTEPFIKRVGVKQRGWFLLHRRHQRDMSKGQPEPKGGSKTRWETVDHPPRDASQPIPTWLAAALKNIRESPEWVSLCLKLQTQILSQLTSSQQQSQQNQEDQEGQNVDHIGGCSQFAKLATSSQMELVSEAFINSKNSTTTSVTALETKIMSVIETSLTRRVQQPKQVVQGDVRVPSGLSTKGMTGVGALSSAATAAATAATTTTTDDAALVTSEATNGIISLLERTPAPIRRHAELQLLLGRPIPFRLRPLIYTQQLHKFKHETQTTFTNTFIYLLTCDCSYCSHAVGTHLRFDIVHEVVPAQQ